MPQYTTLITVEELATQLDDCLVIDCQHNLVDREAGPAAFAKAHIPGARHLHMDDDLASHGEPHLGRHPLPDANELRQKLEALGMTPERQLVAYDAAGGASAGRLWWLARWLGYANAAVLDGGLGAWQQAGYPLADGADPDRNALATPANVSALSQAPTVDTDQLVTNLLSKQFLVVDARTAERYRGETEPMDPVAGHIPGAVNRPLQDNLRPDGRFKPAEVLRAEYQALLGERDASTVVHSCGSGVSACHNLLAMEHAGLTGSILYPGSWSAWCADPDRPVGKA